MEEEVELQLQEANDLMDKAISHTASELNKIRAGKAMPDMLDGIMVQYYGAPTPLNQLASVTAPDAKTIVIKPFEKTIIGDIEKAIINSDIGLNPQNDGEIVRLNIPTLTEERRKNLVKQAKQEAENGKISIRNIRKDIKDELKKLEKEGVSEDEIKKAEEEIQKLTDKHVKDIDDRLERKQDEIMTV